LDSEQNNQSPFVLKARSNKYAKIDLQGYITPFTEKINFHVEGDLTELSLPAVSSYIRDSLGFELKSGHLDTKINITAKGSVLEGETLVVLRGLETSAAKNVDVGDIKQQTPIPLNLALSMLKDKRGNIKLKVPMSGSVDDPSFGAESFIILVTKKAAMLQARSYLLRSFVPYADVISIAISAGDMMLKVHFEDLVFQPAQVDIDKTQQVYIDQFIALMKEKPKAQVKVCGLAIPADITVAGSAIADNKPLNSPGLSGAHESMLRSIAKQREENFKAYVVTKGEIASSRLLLCNPEVDLAEGALPRIKISI
jgi:hypothetical protein